MAKPKGPGLADFAVHLHGHHPLKIRASSILVTDKWLYLRDAGGGVLFAAPEMNLHYVRYLEPSEELAPPERLRDPDEERRGEHVPPKAADGPLFTAIIEPIGVDPAPPAEVANPGPIETGPRKRGERGRFAKA
jgi:hypothetical protein